MPACSRWPASAGVQPREHRVPGLGRLSDKPLELALDRPAAEGAELVLTHDLIAHMLGVRREGVTEAAANCKALD